MQDVRSLSVQALAQHLSAMGQPSFRAQQVHQWLWQKNATSFDAMTNLPAALRQQLAQTFALHPMALHSQQHSTDGTIKSTFRLHDGHLIEGVLIPAEDRMTACVSSQVGCSLTCKFCATGYMERKRNLTAGEIYDQVVAIGQQAQQHFGQPLSNIVYMGMGEPLLNYAEVLQSIEHITSPQGLGMAARRITLSTAGIAKMIKKLGDDAVRFNLALSLHAATEEKRNQIMPINESNNLPALAQALHYFYAKTQNRITLEYILFYDFNDTLADAEALYRFSKQAPVKINIIEYNPISQASYRNTSGDRLDQFARWLEDHGLVVNVRRSRGKDIDAACGQLAVKEGQA